MPRVLVHALPFLPPLAGLWIGAGRFREHDPLTGTAVVLGGLLLMVVVVLRMPGGSAR